MIYRIADFYIDIKTIYARTEAFCKEYLCSCAPYIDFSVEVTPEDIEAEREHARQQGERVFSLPRYEPMALYRKICAHILSKNAFLIHGAVIEYEGKGYLFTAKSGTGKTTHIRLWQQVFGADKVTIVNGDKPILRIHNGKFYAYGTPWCGKEGYNTNTKVELCGICVISRAESNSISLFSEEKAIPALFSQIMIEDSADLAKQLELIDSLLSMVPVYSLECNMDPEAAVVALRGLQGDKK